jgi:thiol:disulfide interchange protein DsbD
MGQLKKSSMKKIILLFIVGCSVLSVQAQRLNPVKWTFEAVKKADKQYDVILTANVEAPWHIYSQFVKNGPIPTDVQFKPNPLVQFKGKVKEVGKLEKMYDKNFDTELMFFSGKVQFIQAITLKVASKTKLSGNIEYQLCNDEKCLPSIKLPFEVAIQ